jgi:excisionase family DNA binding protein
MAISAYCQTSPLKQRLTEVAMSTNLEQTLWTVDETATFLQLKPKTIYDYVSARLIPVIRIGRAVRFSPQAIREWVDSKQDPGLSQRKGRR